MITSNAASGSSSTLTLETLRLSMAQIHSVPVLPKMIETVLAIEPIAATIWQEPPFSPHRSKRLWKKLRKKTARPHPGKPACYQLQDTLYIHPILACDLRARMETKINRYVENALFGGYLGP